MTGLSRRTVLLAIAAAVVAATERSPVVVADMPPHRHPLGLGPSGDLSILPGHDSRLALTVDDGASVEVVAAYAEFCRDSGTRLTFFVNGANESWAVNAPLLRPMVDSGQIQMGNHTWSHPDVTRVGADDVADQIGRNAEFLQNTYGVDAAPYFRPPYGAHNRETDRIAAEFGYTSITLWSSSLDDARLLPEPELIANAEMSFQPGQIVLAHANLPPVTHCYSTLIDIIHSRGLQTVTLREAFG
jgi:peptidoglycan/xylan/chitin deacetylase (PgdA/CDA1 family)